MQSRKCIILFVYFSSVKTKLCTKITFLQRKIPLHNYFIIAQNIDIKFVEKDEVKAVIKGVNRQILEVANTENEYFERVIFFVKPEYSTMEEKKLNFEAAMYAKGNGKPPRVKRRKMEKLFSILRLVAAAGAGAGITAVIMNNFVI